jgi:hypothetical protein
MAFFVYRTDVGDTVVRSGATSQTLGANELQLEVVGATPYLPNQELFLYRVVGSALVSNTAENIRLWKRKIRNADDFITFEDINDVENLFRTDYFGLNPVPFSGSAEQSAGLGNTIISGLTEINENLDNKVDVSGDTVTGDLKVEGSLFVTGTSATTIQLEDAVLLGAITSDGKIVRTNTPALNVSEAVTDISSNTTITELSGIYYVDTTSGDVTIQIPDAAPENDVSRLTILKKSMDSNNVIITTTGGTQLIGRRVTQIISQNDKGLTIVSDADNNKWLVTVDSRFPDGENQGTLLSWNNTDNVWESTTDDVTWDNTGLTFTIGGNSDPQTFQVNAIDDIVYINTSGLTGLTTSDDLGFYAGGRGAFGNEVTIDRLRANAPNGEPRSLSLIDTNSVVRIWRFNNGSTDPAVEFVYGTGETPDDPANSWWDTYLDGSEDSLIFRRRTEGQNKEILRCFENDIEFAVDGNFLQKANLNIYINPSVEEGDFWYDGEGLFFRDSGQTYNLIDNPTALTAVQIRRTTTFAVPATWGDITFDSVDVENDPTIISGDTVNTDNIVVGEDGLYLITYDGVVNDGGQFRLRINDTTVINGSTKDVFTTVAGLATTNTNADVSNTALVQLSAGDFITLQAQQGTAGAATLQIDATVKVAKLDSAKGATGPKGDKGEPGSGVAIIVNDDGVNPSPTGGSYTTLNFGDGIAAVDAGDGQTVNISATTVTPAAADNKLQLVDSVGGQDLNPATATPLTWGQVDVQDTSVFTFTPATSTITVLEDGLYELSLNINGSSGNGRSFPAVQFRRNGTVIAPTLTTDYGRNTSNNDPSYSLPPYLITLNANDTLDVVSFRLGDSTTVTSKAGASFIRVTYLG